ncbi:hypothetical protein GQ600_1329 [Phytophthora cactorum]|nr:hypothetical protein GQ600_1329 [Phytophthora cactorum]
MKAALQVGQDDHPVGLQHCYRAPPHLPLLDGVLVSPQGDHCYVDETSTHRAWLLLCKECDRSIAQENCQNLQLQMVLHWKTTTTTTPAYTAGPNWLGWWH